MGDEGAELGGADGLVHVAVEQAEEELHALLAGASHHVPRHLLECLKSRRIEVVMNDRMIHERKFIQHVNHLESDVACSLILHCPFHQSPLVGVPQRPSTEVKC